MNMKTRLGRGRDRRYTQIALKGTVIFIVLAVVYTIGFANGQSSAYEKMTDDVVAPYKGGK